MLGLLRLKKVGSNVAAQHFVIFSQSSEEASAAQKHPLDRSISSAVVDMWSLQCGHHPLLQRQRTPITMQPGLSSRRRLRDGAAPRALFGGRKQAAPEPAPPPAKRGLFGGGKAAKPAVKEAPKKARGLFQKAEKAVKDVSKKP